jgi:hypothetical protein
LIDPTARGNINSGPDRRVLQQLSRGGFKRKLRQSAAGNPCFCSAASIDNGLTAPRQEAFAEKVNETVVNLAAFGEIPNVKGVLATLDEIIEFDCGGEPDSFELIVFADLFQNEAAGSSILEEMQLLSTLFGEKPRHNFCCAHCHFS